MAVMEIKRCKYFPKAWSHDEMAKLPQIIKIINHVFGFVIHSGGNGLFGLFTDYPLNIQIGEVERSLKAIGATRSLKFLRTVKAVLPGKKYPETVAEAELIEAAIINSYRDKTVKTRNMRICMDLYAGETSSLPEELRQYLRRNLELLSQTLVALNK